MIELKFGDKNFWRDNLRIDIEYRQRFVLLQVYKSHSKHHNLFSSV